MCVCACVCVCVWGGGGISTYFILLCIILFLDGDFIFGVKEGGMNYQLLTTANRAVKRGDVQIIINCCIRGHVNSRTTTATASCISVMEAAVCRPGYKWC